MRILFTRFPLESNHGGAEVQTLSLMRALIARGHVVEFLGSCSVLLEAAARIGAKVTRLDIGPPPVTKIGAVSFLWRRNAMRTRLIAAMAEFKDVEAVCMLSLSEKLLLTGTLASRGVPVLWIEHDRVGRWLRKNPWLPALRRLSTSAMTVCVSALSRAIYLELGWPAEKTVTIPNGIDVLRFGADIVRPRRDGGPLRIGCVARLSHDKGVDVLVEAIAGMPDTQLDIVGTGREEAFLRNFAESIARREMQEVPRIRIWTSVEDLGELYHSLDCLVLPSREHDPFGLTAAEAMVLGVPTIVTDVCGIAGYLQNGLDALIVPADDAEALRAALERMRDPALRTRLGKSGSATVCTRFTLEAMTDAYEQLLSAA